MNIDLTQLESYSDEFLRAAFGVIAAELKEREYIARDELIRHNRDLARHEYIRCNRVGMEELQRRAEAAWQEG